MSKVPAGWEVKNLGDIATVTSGGTPSRDNIEYWNGAIPWVRTTEVKNCPLYYNDIKEFITEDGLKNSSAKLVPENSVLIAMIGQGKTRGQVAILKLPACTNQNCGIAIFDSNSDADFYFQFLLSQYEAIRKFSNSAGQSNLSGALLKKITMPVPPLPEQTKIAQILSTWDKAIATTEQLIGNSQQQKKALMQSLLTGKKRLPGFEKLNEYQTTRYGKIPLDWGFKQIDDIAKNISIKNKEGKDYPVLSCSKHSGFIDSLKYFNKKVYSDNTSGYKIIKKGWFGFPSNHIEEGSIGLQDLYEVGIVSPIYIIFGVNEKFISSLYLYALFKTDHYKQIFSASTNASVDRRGSLRWDEFGKIKVPVPSLPEQQKIAQILTAADNEIELLQKKLVFLKQEKTALMQQLLTGKRRVKINATEECMDA
ncbi:restriction endonuclease subunit S [Rahnella woolbedingensis]|uniref:Restriction endonuclease subunit S n=1 Tax=Rahnella woolbedingensis TaxID=1510574 RepID=A0A419N983_9GAMM|nr:restriction endonuclease subunit S [Rahnella woolbedingensis]RJT44317.1 restriction endonuclease subunit S [Rahnella woolbedingensis]